MIADTIINTSFLSVIFQNKIYHDFELKRIWIFCII